MAIIRAGLAHAALLSTSLILIGASPLAAADLAPRSDPTGWCTYHVEVSHNYAYQNLTNQYNINVHLYGPPDSSGKPQPLTLTALDTGLEGSAEWNKKAKEGSDLSCWDSTGMALKTGCTQRCWKAQGLALAFCMTPHSYTTVWSTDANKATMSGGANYQLSFQYGANKWDSPEPVNCADNTKTAILTDGPGQMKVGCIADGSDGGETNEDLMDGADFPMDEGCTC